MFALAAAIKKARKTHNRQDNTTKCVLLQLKIIAAWYTTLEQAFAKNAMWTASFRVHSRSVSNKTKRLIENTAEILHKDLCLVFQISKWTYFLACQKSYFWMNHSNMREDMILAISSFFNKSNFQGYLGKCNHWWCGYPDWNRGRKDAIIDSSMGPTNCIVQSQTTATKWWSS